jgi:adenosine deaminase
METEPRPLPPLAELHLHLYGCIGPENLLRHLANSERVQFEEYEERMQDVFGFVPPVRELVERFREGDQSAVQEFADVFVFSDDDAGSFARFEARGLILWATEPAYDNPNFLEIVDQQGVDFAKGIRADFEAQGVEYAELRTFPCRRLLEQFAMSEEALTLRLAVSLDRRNPGPVWELVKKLALSEHGDALTAIDFCGIEEGFPPKDKAAFFAEVHAFNEAHPERALAILYHVGEVFTDKSIESAIRWVHEAAELGAHRLGHAIALGIDPNAFGSHTRTESVSERIDQINYDLKHKAGLSAAGVVIDDGVLQAELRQLAEKPAGSVVDVHYDDRRLAELVLRQDFAIEAVRQTGAVIEVCPTSNRRVIGLTNPMHHPIHRFLKADLPVVISSDDPGNFGVTLNDELDWVCGAVTGGADLRRKLLQTAWASRSEVLSGRQQ